MSQFRHLSPNQLVAIYLMASYLYYHEDKNYMMDFEFDELCQYMHDNFDQLKEARLFKLIKKEHLKAGTGFHLGKKDFPRSLIMNAQYCYNVLQKRKLASFMAFTNEEISKRYKYI